MKNFIRSILILMLFLEASLMYALHPDLHSSPLKTSFVNRGDLTPDRLSFFIPCNDKGLNGFYAGSSALATGNQTGAAGKYTDNSITPGIVQGYVSCCPTGTRITGASVRLSSSPPAVTYTVNDPVHGNGWYSMSVNPPGSFNLTCSKAGFRDTIVFFTVNQGQTVNVNICFAVSPGSPSLPFQAQFANPPNQVDLSWEAPQQPYELLYDDGIGDYSTVWNQSGNQWAVRFSSVSAPVEISHLLLNIGPASDYPAGTTPQTLHNFTIQIYDATGTGGTPGNPISDALTVQPYVFGWNDFNYSSFPVINCVNWYVVMTQGGTPPNAARIEVDNTNPQLRSYSRFVTGSGSWLPADGNLMIRCHVIGAGGPCDCPPGILYQVWRLHQGEEGNQNLWTSVWSGAGNSCTDASWPSLSDGAYRWAAKALYNGAQWSIATFSDVLGKNWVAGVTVQASLSCSPAPKNGTLVNLHNTMTGVDSTYNGTTNADGKVTFPHVWKGTYTLTASRPGYTTATSTVTIMNDQTINTSLLQIKIPVSNVHVDGKSLVTTWNPPSGNDYNLNENWGSGQFSTNGWTPAGNGQWQISNTAGNPAPSAMFNWTPVATNYSYPLTSKPIAGYGASPWILNWDIFFSDYSASGTEYLDVQIGTGANPSTWTTIKSYTNTASIPWTSETYDITSYTNQTICIRFLAHGSYSFYINNWNVDNVSTEPSFPNPRPCVLAYNIYLNNNLDGTASDTSYHIPGSHVMYDSVYTACVKPVYGSGYSGYSSSSCYTFTSIFLWPPTNLQVQAVECVAYLTWHKPAIQSKTHVPPFKGFIEHTPPSSGLAPSTFKQTNKTDSTAEHTGDIRQSDRSYRDETAITLPPERTPDLPAASTAFAAEAMAFGTVGYFDVNNLPGYLSIITDPATQFTSALVYPLGNTSWAYGGGYGETDLFTYNRTTGLRTSLGNIGHSFNGLTINPKTNIIYGNDGTNGNLYTIDPNTPSATLIGSYGASANMMIGIACDGNGNLWGYDIGNDMFYSINKSTGTATPVGSIGFNANYAQSLFYDQSTGNILMGAFNAGIYYGQIRVVDVTTGNSTVMSQAYYYEITAATAPLNNSTEPAGILGYKVYCDGNDSAHYIDYVSGKDTTWYYDYQVDPGTHTYSVSAWYDLTPYGHPGQKEESTYEGPKTLNIVCCVCMPFYEPWDQFSWTYHNWTHNGNWTLTPTEGNPAPSADFKSDPAVTNYSHWIRTITLDASPYTCAKVWCDYDYKLIDQNHTGKEHLTVEEFIGGTYKTIADYSNNGDVDWKHAHIGLTNTIGKHFKIRFRAHGENSADIKHWFLDNINIYIVCKRPTYLFFGQNHNKVYLTWNAPNCSGYDPESWVFDDETWEDGISINPGYTISLGNYFPLDPTFSATIQSFDNWFLQYGNSTAKTTILTVYDAGGNVLGTSAPFVNYDGWVNVPVPDIDFTGPFYAMIDYTTSGSIMNYLLMDEDGPYVTGNGLAMGLYNGSFTDCNTLFGKGPGNFCQRGYGKVLNKKMDLIAGRKTVSEGLSNNKIPEAASILPENKVIKDYPPPHHRKSYTSTNALLGYNVYRTDSTASPPYHKINDNYVTSTTYVDVLPTYTFGYFRYYVTANYKDTVQNIFLCESPGSDTIMAQYPPIIGINEINRGMISVYPNPADKLVNIQCDYMIHAIDVTDYFGRTVSGNTIVQRKMTTLDISGLNMGIYFLKVNTEEGIRFVKLMVSH